MYNLKNNYFGGKRHDELIPILSRFAVFRPESSGGILFYAPLSLEEHLGMQEAFIVSMCNGSNSISLIKKQLSEKFGLSHEETDEKVNRVLEKAINTGAIDLKDSSKRKQKGKERDKISQKVFTHNTPKSIIWYITQKCNLHCQHCLLEGGAEALRELSENEAQRLIDELGELGVLYLSLSGGEPLLREDLFRLIDHAASYGMRVDLASNGTLIDKRMVRRIAHSRVFQVQVSIDGSEDVHNIFRGKNSAYKFSVKAVRRMLDEGIIVSISHTVRKGLVSDVEKVIDWAVGMQCAGIKIIPFYPVGRGKQRASQFMLSKKEITQLYCMIEKKRKDVPCGFQIYTEMDYLMATAGLKEQKKFMYCPAGKETLAVYPDGTLYPCPFLTDFPVGKWPEDRIENIWNHSSLLAILRRFTAEEVNGKCRECRSKSLCGGGCRAFACYFGSTIESIDPYCLASENENINTLDEFLV